MKPYPGCVYSRRVIRKPSSAPHAKSNGQRLIWVASDGSINCLGAVSSFLLHTIIGLPGQCEGISQALTCLRNLFVCNL